MKFKRAGTFILCVVLAGCISGCAVRGGAETAEGNVKNNAKTSVEAEDVAKKKAAPTPEPTKSPEELAKERLDSVISGMSVEEKVAQLFLVRVPETNAAALQEEYQFGSYILFARDFEGKTPESVTADIDSYQRDSKLPMLIGVDEEGGIVNRVSKYPAFRKTPFLSPQALGKKGGLELIAKDTVEKSELLLSLGINFNLAPVCDLSQNPNDFIYSRTYGKSAMETAEYVKAVVGAMQNSGIASALKHFPGYGSNADTHTGIAYDSRPLEQFKNEDFLPFKAGIDSGAPVVLVSHNIVKSIDSERPASLSGKVHEILRSDLGFDGVILTDDLIMQGITDFAGSEAAAVMAVKAGNDMLCCSDYVNQYPAVLNAVNTGEITEERIEESVRRILRLKQQMGLI